MLQARHRKLEAAHDFLHGWTIHGDFALTSQFAEGILSKGVASCLNGSPR